MGSFFGGGGTTTTSTNATTGPSSQASPYLYGAADAAQSLYNQGVPQIWQGQYLAPQSSQTTGAVQGITDYTASGVPQNLITSGQNVAQNIAGGANLYGGNQYLNSLLYGGNSPASQYAQNLMGTYGSGGPQNMAQALGQGLLSQTASGNITQNPYLNSMYQQASLPIIQQWQNQIQPGLESAFSSAGRYGNVNQNPTGSLASSLNQAQTGLGQALGNLGANLYGNAYGQNLQAQTSAQNALATLGLGQSGQQINLGTLLGNLQGQNVNAASALNLGGAQGAGVQLSAATSLPNLAMSGYSPYSALANAGQTMDTYNNANQQYQEQVYNYLNGGGAWQTLGNYTNLLAENPAMRSTTTTGTTTQQAPTQSGFSQALGGLSGLSSLTGFGGGTSGIGNMLGFGSGGSSGLFGSSGLLGSLFGSGGSSAASLFGGDTLSSGFSDALLALA